uniref:Uncharacterized protein n=1 Tax=Caenorhabditis japonica TaxID=281687 RepID=A0A8R1IIT0_CAEJA
MFSLVGAQLDATTSSQRKRRRLHESCLPSINDPGIHYCVCQTFDSEISSREYDALRRIRIWRYQSLIFHDQVQNVGSSRRHSLCSIILMCFIIIRTPTPQDQNPRPSGPIKKGPKNGTKKSGNLIESVEATGNEVKRKQKTCRHFWSKKKKKKKKTSNSEDQKASSSSQFPRTNNSLIGARKKRRRKSKSTNFLSVKEGKTKTKKAAMVHPASVEKQGREWAEPVAGWWRRRRRANRICDVTFALTSSSHTHTLIA